MKNLLTILALIAAVGCMVLSLADGIDRQITVDNLTYGEGVPWQENQ